MVGQAILAAAQPGARATICALRDAERPPADPRTSARSASAGAGAGQQATSTSAGKPGAAQRLRLQVVRLIGIPALATSSRRHGGRARAACRHRVLGAMPGPSPRGIAW